MDTEKLEQSIKEARELLDQVERKLEDSKQGVTEKDRLQKGDIIYFINQCGDVDRYEYYGEQDIPFVNKLRAMNNFFRTSKEAERHGKRLQSMKKTWLPKWGENYWAVGSPNIDMCTIEVIWNEDAEDFNYYHLGRVFKTEGEAWAWIKEYADVWTTSDVEDNA